MQLRILIIALILSVQVTGQNKLQFLGNVGLNRIGVFYDLGIRKVINQNDFRVSFRLYEPDIVFEKNYPGINLGYRSLFSLSQNEANKVQFGIGLDIGYFAENKGSTRLDLFDPKLIGGPIWKLGEHWNLFSEFGIGLVVNRVETTTLINIQYFNYLNYQISLGITYR